MLNVQQLHKLLILVSVCTKLGLSFARCHVLSVFNYFHSFLFDMAHTTVLVALVALHVRRQPLVVIEHLHTRLAEQAFYLLTQMTCSSCMKAGLLLSSSLNAR